MTKAGSVKDVSVHCNLPADTASVKVARHFVAAALDGVEREIVEIAALLVSELVTNSILHARSASELAVEVTNGRVLITVRDASPTIPARRGFATDASTGRGLHILEALATRWGVEADQTGKTVWFEIDRLGDVARTPDQEALVTIEIEGLPIPIYQLASEAYQGITREFRLMIEADPVHHESAPARLLEVIAEIEGRYSTFSLDQSAALERAVTSGAESITLTYSLPPSAGPACRHLNSILDEIDEYCSQGRWLLSVAPSPEAIAFRRWFLGEFDRQIAGARPTAFTENDEYRTLG